MEKPARRPLCHRGSSQELKNLPIVLPKTKAEDAAFSTAAIEAVAEYCAATEGRLPLIMR